MNFKDIENIEEKIDKFLTQKMSKDEKINFQKQIESDPQLAKEVNFQKMVIKGIQQYRKTELKKQIAAVSVSSSLWVVIRSYSKLKLASMFVLASLVGFGTYTSFNHFLFDNTKKYTTNNSISDNNSLINFPQPLKIPQIVLPKKVIVEVQKIVEIEKKVYIEVVKEEAKATINESSNKTLTPSVNLPKGLENVDNFKMAHINTEDENFNDIANENYVKTTNNFVDIEIIENKFSKDLKYIYFNKKLKLIGDFSKAPYEILEIIANGKKEIFLYYDNQYYLVKITKKAENLIKITDDKILKYLNIVKENKVNRN